MEISEIPAALELHVKWLRAEPDGKRFDAVSADLRSANLGGADLRSANLGGADLWGADLWGADLRSANLWGADLRGADLWSANLRSANLWGADLRSADLRSADLRGADLWSANLGGADLRGADLWSANLGSANLWGADLRSAKITDDLTYEQIVHAEIGPIGSRNDHTALFAFPDGRVEITTSCFRGDLAQFRAAIASTHAEETLYRIQYDAAADLFAALIRAKFGIREAAQ